MTNPSLLEDPAFLGKARVAGDHLGRSEVARDRHHAAGVEATLDLLDALGARIDEGRSAMAAKSRCPHVTCNGTPRLSCAKSGR